jgi:hypothetical protein
MLACTRGGRDECERHTVIGIEVTNVPVEQCGLGECLEEEGSDEYEQREGGGDEAHRRTRKQGRRTGK